MVCYYGRHYWAYFYSEHLDSWLKFDDEKLTKVGSFQSVVDLSVKGRAVPRILFYEREDCLRGILKADETADASLVSKIEGKSKDGNLLYYNKQ